MNFKKLNLSSAMMDTLELIGYETPSPIQEAAIPVALEGKDIIGQAQTGTGKTAAFGIPIIELTKPGEGLQHVILAPSRELATQIYNEIHKLSANKGIKVIDIIGGVSYDIQRRALKQNPDIVVATPGRYIDNLEKGLINHDKVTTFTLDEADEMLNFGFYKDILKIKKTIKGKVQTFFFTATFNDKIKKLAKEILTDPVEVTISGGLSTTDKVDQKYMVVKEKRKLTTLVSLLQINTPVAAVIFGRTRRRVEELTGALKTLGFKATGIQGDIRQKERAIAMDSFRKGRVNILVGTDVMARGIDVEAVDFVFNFDLPTEIEAYTHRIGRTGRAGKKGTAISFVKPSEEVYFEQIMRNTNSLAEELEIPTDNDLKQFKEKELESKLDTYLEQSKGRFDSIGAQLASRYTPEQLGNIIAQLAIGESLNVYDIKLTGEQGVESKGRGRSRSGRGRGRGGNRGGNRGGDRNRSGGNRSGGNRGGDRNRSGGNRGGGNRGGDRNRSGGNRERSGKPQGRK